MLVEDDNNLREIYEARLLAEGYEIVSARDGEEALAIAVKEKPDLIISDVMMPKISGFDMLDILRSTPETRNTKVIMMTALSQAEDKARADKLGADKYLVKSQVTLEDVARVAAEVLSGETSPGIDSAAPSVTAAAPLVDAPAPANPEPPAAPTATVTAADTPTPTAPVAAQPVSSAPAAPVIVTDMPISPAPVPAQPVAVAPMPAADPVVTPMAVEPEEKEDGSGSSKRIIQPLNDLTMPSKDLNDLAAKQEAMEAAANPIPTLPPVNEDAPIADTIIAPTTPEGPATSASL